MEPYRFEENIREKFEEREIEPSKNAWEKLDAQLDNHDEKSGNKFTWMAIAAGFVGILIIASLVFNQDKISGNTENNQVVVENVKFENPEKNIQQNEMEDKVLASEEIVSEKNVEKINVKNNATSNHEEVIADNIPKKNTLNSKEKSIPINDLENVAVTVQNTEKEVKIEQKVIDVVAQIKQLQNQNYAVSATEIDVLLAKAQRELKAERVFNPTRNKVDAKSLLENAEWQADRSFRDKIFVALGEGFEKVRTAVVERNQ